MAKYTNAAFFEVDISAFKVALDKRTVKIHAGNNFSAVNPNFPSPPYTNGHTT